MKNNFWSQVPFLRLLPAVLVGILTAIYAAIIPLMLAWGFSFVLIFSLSFFIVFKKYFSSYRLRWITGIHFYSLSFLFFYILTLENTSHLDPQHFENKISGTEAFIGHLAEEPIEKTKSRKAEIKIVALKNNERWLNCTGKVLAYINRDALSKDISYGDMIFFSATPSPTKPPANPAQFDYQRFLHFHQIEHQVYIAEGKWKPLNANCGNALVRFAVNVRKKLLNIYRQNNIKGQEFAVLSALTLGYVDEIDGETLRSFSASGAMHVLSVSGQHVGIIFIALKALLFFLERGRTRRIIQACLLLLMIWGYVIITGMSPAVLRSGAMITFIIVGKALNRRTNIFNTIAASAIFLFATNPYLIMEVGFQLSYLAVSGIVLIQPWVYKQWYFKSRITNALWELTSISIAAQLATFPLGLLYFQQFPNYFVFSNLIVIPLATIIIYGGILLLLISSYVLSLAVPIAAVVNFLTWLLNSIVAFIEKLPYSITTGISIDIFQTWLIYLFIVALCLFIVRKSTLWLRLSLSLFILLLALWLMGSINISKQKQFVVYDINGITAVQFTRERNSVLIADSTLLQNKSSMQFNINRNIYALGISSMDTISTEASQTHDAVSSQGIFFKSNFVLFNGEKYFITDDSFPNYFKAEKKIILDAVLVTGKSVRNISSLTNKFSFSKLIITSSVPDWLKNKLQQQCAEKNILCYAVSDKGAYVSFN